MVDAKTALQAGPLDKRHKMYLRVLVIEDDETIASFIADNLKKNGHTVDLASDGIEGLYRATEGKYDVMVVDRMLPKIDGLTLIQTLRSSNNLTPVLILSALGQTEERVHGLQAGGDDYLPKPFQVEELLARLEALARRSTAEPEQTSLRVGALEMDLISRTVNREGTPIVLQNREFRLLEFFMRRPNQVITRTMLLEGVWDFHFNPQTNLIDAQISKLRQKIDKSFDKPMLHTIRGVGYKLCA